MCALGLNNVTNEKKYVKQNVFEDRFCHSEFQKENFLSFYKYITKDNCKLLGNKFVGTTYFKWITHKIEMIENRKNQFR